MADNRLDSARKISPEVEDEDDAFEQELEEAGLVEPPDGGYGWVIVFGSFLANVIVDGLIFTAGAGFLPQWEKYYEVSQGTAAWSVSLLSGNYLLAGPIASALANYYGCRAVTIAGTLLSSAGFLISLFAPKVWVLYITFGIIGGIGFGMMYLPSIVIVSYYFKDKRALATGIAVSGSGIGTMIFAPFTKFLLELYSWQQALLIMTGITLNGLVSGALFRALEPTVSQVEEVAVVAQKYTDVGTKETNGKVASEVTSEVVKYGAYPQSHVMEGVDIERFVSSPGRQTSDSSRRSRTRTDSHHPFMSVMELRARERHTSLFSVDSAAAESSAAMNRDELYRIISRESIAQLNRPLSRMDIFYPGSVHSLHGHSPRKRRPTGVITDASRPSLMLSAMSVAGAGGELPAEGNWRENLVATLKTILDVSLLKSPTFLLLAVGGFLTLTTFFVPFIYLPRQAIHLGHGEEKATMLISILGVTNIVARIGCGYLSDQPWADALVVHNVAVTVGGVATILVPFIKSYALLCFYCVVFGVGTACFASLRSIVCVELLGLEKLTSAYGFLLLFMGVAALLGSPIAGTLSDLTGNYDVSFYIMGAILTLSGLIGFPLRRLNNWEKRRDGIRDYEDRNGGDGQELQELVIQVDSGKKKSS